MKVKEMAKKLLKTLTLGEKCKRNYAWSRRTLGIDHVSDCIHYCMGKGSAVDVVYVTIFSICLFMMFLMSTIYHCMPHDSRQKAS